MGQAVRGFCQGQSPGLSPAYPRWGIAPPQVRHGQAVGAPRLNRRELAVVDPVLAPAGLQAFLRLGAGGDEGGRREDQQADRQEPRQQCPTPFCRRPITKTRGTAPRVEPRPRPGRAPT